MNPNLQDTSKNPPDSDAQPYAGLTPDAVTDALCSLGLSADGRLLALNSYENRVYQAGIEDQTPVVVKFYRPRRWSNEAIAEEHEFTEQLAQAQIPVVAPTVINNQTLHSFEGFRFSVFRRQGGRAPELDNPDVLQWLGRLMGRIHAVGQLQQFQHRPTLNMQTFGLDPRDYLLRNGFIPPDIRPAWESVVQMALDEVARCYERAGKLDLIRLHGDCHAGNVLWTDAGPHFVDFDDARNGPAIQDLWMLLSGDRYEMTSQLSEILDGYGQFCDFPSRQLHLLEALRTLRLLHYSGWLAQRWQDPAFPVAFPWFNTQRYWQDRVLELKEQVALMQEPPLSP
ncbi:MAG: serine/threonine protein kinase [Burkholderiales bacterium]|jgi:Ser/Thr protein kinase RdoA (MazF antagonist)|nr:serine/threonine protein kinase [Burkholderiales bacterium]